MEDVDGASHRRRKRSEPQKMQMKQLTKDADGVDQAQIADESQRTKNINRMDNLGINSRQATEDIDKTSYGRRKQS